MLCTSIWEALLFSPRLSQGSADVNPPTHGVLAPVSDCLCDVQRISRRSGAVVWGAQPTGTALLDRMDGAYGKILV